MKERGAHKEIIPVVAAVITESRLPFHPRLFLLHTKVEGADEEGVPRNPELLGKWEYPGGMVKHGESPEEALHREIKEELHIPVCIGNLIHASSFVTNEHYLVLFYLCSLNTFLPAIADSRWFTKAEIDVLSDESALSEIKIVAQLVSQRL